MTDTPGDADLTEPPDWTFAQWLTETRALRTALATLGVRVPHCLPGEPRDCGAPAPAHYASYLGLLRARADLFWRSNLDTEHLMIAMDAYTKATAQDGDPPR